MIRQPKRDERRQIIPLIELIMQDMELPILEHTSPEMLYAMLEEAMLDDQFRYGLKNTLVYIMKQSRWGHLRLPRTLRRRD